MQGHDPKISMAFATSWVNKIVTIGETLFIVTTKLIVEVKMLSLEGVCTPRKSKGHYEKDME